MRLLLLGAALAPAACFYLPGVAPRDYADGEHVDMKVNKLTSTKTQLPYEYYALPFSSPTRWRTWPRTSARCCAATAS